jgi:hypothetical protein
MMIPQHGGAVYVPYVHQAAFVQTPEDTYSDSSTNISSSADPEEVRLLGLKPLSYDEVLYGNESIALNPKEIAHCFSISVLSPMYKKAKPVKFMVGGMSKDIAPCLDSK